MEKETLEKAKAWANNQYFDDEARAEVQKLIDDNNTDEIIDRFYKDLEFGTGGIRGIINYGINRINRYTIMKATQALATEVNKQPNEIKRVAICYDSRRFSLEFAKITASVFAANNIHSYIYKELNPVCLLSFSVRYHKAQAGVMITASHNPPEYNGYKVYWDDGCQVTAPYDKNIIDSYNAISDFAEIKIMDFEEAENNDLIHWVDHDVVDNYLNLIKNKAINPEMCAEHGDKLNFVYTALHGTGYKPCTQALRELNLKNFHLVPEQTEPDGNFPTVKSPNPENAEALKMAVDLMKEKNSSVAFGTDPDADRIGVAVNHKGQVHYLSGNQIGSLLLYYTCENLSSQKKMPSNPYCVKTIVTTDLQQRIAEHYGVKIENTLTGFKWICGLMREIENTNPERTFLFGTEESFGYLNHDYVRDKDGVAPITLLAEMTLWYQLRNMTLIDALDEIFEKFGFHHEVLLNLNYYGADGESKISKIMEHFRAYPENTLCGEQIIAIEDYKSSKIKNLGDGVIHNLTLPKSNVLGFIFESGTKLYLRPSGTEPKIKFYLLIQEKSGTLDENRIKALKKSETVMNFIKSECENI